MGVFNAMFSLSALSAMVEAQSKMTCAEVKGVYKSNECCGNPNKEVDLDDDDECYEPVDPMLFGVMPPLNDRPHFIIATDIDSPPYAFLENPPFDSPGDLDQPVGVGPDMIKAMGKYCGFDVTVTQAHWNDCWGEGEIGQGLREGWYHGCMLYTHVKGMRNRYMEFSDSFEFQNKASGFITRLQDGKPVVKGTDNLNGKTVVDVTGWAPTADGIQFVKNTCTGKDFSRNYTMVQGDDVKFSPDGSKYASYVAKGPNDKALLAVLNGVADVLWIDAAQAFDYQCPAGSTADTQAGWNCALWNLWKTDFAYIQGGQLGYVYNGTTISMSKKGSGVAKVMDACLQKFLPTKEYYEQCKKVHAGQTQLSQCIPNEFIKADPEYEPISIAKQPWLFPTSDMAGAGESCATGWCTCEE